MSKSIMYAVNSTTQAVANGGIINFGSPVYRTGCNLNMMAGNVVISGTGYYFIDTNINLIFAEAGTATITLYKDGVAIPGGVAVFTATVGDTAVSIPAVVREKCCCDSVITAVLTGVGASITNASISIEKSIV